MSLLILMSDEDEDEDAEATEEIGFGIGSSGVIESNCSTSSESKLIPGFSGGLGLSVLYSTDAFLFIFCRTASEDIRSILTTGLVWFFLCPEEELRSALELFLGETDVDFRGLQGEEVVEDEDTV